MNEFFIVEYNNKGMAEFESFEFVDAAKERVKDLFECGNEYGVKLAGRERILSYFRPIDRKILYKLTRLAVRNYNE